MKVLGMGDNVVDRYINKRIMFPGGNGVNFAVYAKQCGEDASYLGLLADDREGMLVHDSLKELEIDVSRCEIREGIATERCDVRLEDGDRIFVGCDYGERGEDAWTPLTLTEAHLAYLESFDVVHCGCYAAMEDEMSKLENIQALRSFDFSAEEEYRTDAYLQKVCPYIDIALFSAAEMDARQQEAVRHKAMKLGTKMVLITDGTNGQKLGYDGKEYHGTVKRVEPVDTMGAGDSFFTAFVISMARSGFCQKGDTGRQDVLTAQHKLVITEQQIREAFAFAADFSAKTCLVEGAFGFGTAY